MDSNENSQAKSKVAAKVITLRCYKKAGPDLGTKLYLKLEPCRMADIDLSISLTDRSDTYDVRIPALVTNAGSGAFSFEVSIPHFFTGLSYLKENWDLTGLITSIGLSGNPSNCIEDDDDSDDDEDDEDDDEGAD